MEIKKLLGIRNTTSPERLKPGELSVGQNIDIDNTGKGLTRRGQTNKNSTSGLHSLYANHAVSLVGAGQVLKAVESDFSLTTLKQLTTNADLTYETVGDTVYYSNGVDTGRMVGRTWSGWGVAHPVSQPVATQTSGSLREGRYIYAITYVRSDGHESGTGIAGSIDLTSTGGILFTSIETSQNPDVVSRNLYISAWYGEVMYLVASIPNSVSYYTYASNGLDMTIPLTTQFHYPPPAGTLIHHYNGIMYVVVGDTVYFSMPYGHELFRLDIDFLRFRGKVVMLEGVNDGMYIGTEDLGGAEEEGAGETVFMSGDRPDKTKLVSLFDYGIKAGTAVLSDAAYFESPVAGEKEGASARPAVVWATRHGICIGKDGGVAENLTEPRYSMPTAQSGAAFVRQARGFASYIVSLRGIGSSNNAYAETI